MAEWFARYPNDNGEYEITFRGTYTQAKKVEELCHKLIDDSREEKKPITFKLTDKSKDILDGLHIFTECLIDKGIVPDRAIQAVYTAAYAEVVRLEIATIN